MQPLSTDQPHHIDNNPDLRSLNFDQFPRDGGKIKVMLLNQQTQITVLQP